jgi:hypothetical protein
VTVDPLQASIVGTDLRTTSLVLGGVVLFVLLLACAKHRQLDSRPREIGRTRELAVRAALGGTRFRIARLLLVECLLLGALGGLAGIALAWVLVRTAPLVHSSKHHSLVNHPDARLASRGICVGGDAGSRRCSSDWLRRGTRRACRSSKP